MVATQVHLLVFQLDGQLYGVNVEQVEAILEAMDAGELVPLQPLAAWLGLDPPEDARSRVLLSRSSGELVGFLVDTPRDLVTLPLEDVFPIPSLIRRVLGPSPLWGVGRSSKGLLLLVDLAHRREFRED